MRRVPLTLTAGAVILLLLAVVMAFPELVSNRNPYDRQRLKFSYEEGRLDIDAAPFPPSADFPLGSDDLGRDILSYIAHGTRLTIMLGMLTAVGRFLLAVPAAFAAASASGTGNRLVRSLVNQANVLVSAIPALLVCIILLRLEVFMRLDKASSVLVFVIILSGVGWPKLAGLLVERVESIGREPYIRGAAAIGKRRSRILLEHVLPHLAPEMIVFFFMEIARALTLLMQLGIFSVFIGNLKVVADSEGGLAFFNISFEPEWASMLSTSRELVSVAPWAVIFPALAFFISVLGFNLFGEGLREIMQRKGSKAVPIFRKLTSGEWAGAVRMICRRTRILFFLVLVGAATLVLLPVLEGRKKPYPPWPAAADMPEQVVIGSEAAGEAAVRVAAAMESLGLEPLFGEDYRREYPIGNAGVLSACSFTIEGAGIGSSPEYGSDPEYGRDYWFFSGSTIAVSGPVFDASRIDLYSREDFSDFAGRIVMIDMLHYSDEALSWFIERAAERTDVQGFLLTARPGEEGGSPIVQRSDDCLAAVITTELAAALKRHPEAVVTLSARIDPLESRGVNIGGIRTGEDRFIGDEAVLLAFGYNYLDAPGRDAYAWSLELMKRAAALEGLKRSLIFLFLDGTLNPDYDGMVDIGSDFPYEAVKVQVCIDLRRMTGTRFDRLVFSSAQAPFTRQFAWSLAYTAEQDLRRSGIPMVIPDTKLMDNEYLFTRNAADNVMFWEAGIPAVLLAAAGTPEGRYDAGEIARMVIAWIEHTRY